jgi:DNA-binding cell septation regulator SpoVG
LGLLRALATNAVWTSYAGRVAPRFWPEGGSYTTSVAVTIDCPAHNGMVHYQTCDEFAGLDASTGWTGEQRKCAFPDSLAGLAALPSMLSGGSVVMRDRDHVLLARCTNQGALVGEAHNASYQVATGRYGYGYFVPYYNDAEGFSGKLARMDLRSQAEAPDFANFQTRLGLGPYDDQLHVLDLAALDPDLKGFVGGFAAVSAVADLSNPGGGALPSPGDGPIPLFAANVTGAFANFGYLVPHFNGRAFGKLVRVNLDYFGLCGFSTQEPSGSSMHVFKDKEGRWCNVPRITTKVAPKWLNDSASLRYTPVGAEMSGPCAVDVLNLEAIDADLRGFSGGFELGSHGYVVPQHNGVNASSKVARFHLAKWPTQVEVLDLAAVDPELRGFHGGFGYAGFGYFVPYRHSFGPVFGINSKHPVDENARTAQYHGKLVRVAADDFSPSGVTVLDLSGLVDDSLRGFMNGFVAGRHAYLVPHANRNGVPTPGRGGNSFGKLVRVDLERFDAASVVVLDLQGLDPRFAGFSGGFASGKYGYLVPFVNGRDNYRGKKEFGAVLRIDLDKFSALSVRVLDLPTWEREQTPKMPDHNLRGFSGGFAAGDFGYFVPHFNGRFFGKVVRLDLKTLAVQIVDMRLDNPGLSGFSSGFTHRDRMICRDPQIGHAEIVKNHPSGGCQPPSSLANREPNKFCGSREYRYSPFGPFSGKEPEMLPYAVKDTNYLTRLPAVFMEIMNHTEFATLRSEHVTKWLQSMGPTEPVRFDLHYANLPHLLSVAKGRSLVYSYMHDRLLAKYGKERFDLLWNDVMEPVMTWENTKNNLGEFAKCCNFVDQHTVEYVLWDRRAYTRGQRKVKALVDVSLGTCLFAKCKKERIDGRNALEGYLYNIKNTVEDEEKGIAKKVSDEDKTTITEAVKEALEWLDDNQEAEKEDYEKKQKETEKIINPIMQKVYQ